VGQLFVKAPLQLVTSELLDQSFELYTAHLPLEEGRLRIQLFIMLHR
jgi:hypothetical protein